MLLSFPGQPGRSVDTCRGFRCPHCALDEIHPWLLAAWNRLAHAKYKHLVAGVCLLLHLRLARRVLRALPPAPGQSLARGGGVCAELRCTAAGGAALGSGPNTNYGSGLARHSNLSLGCTKIVWGEKTFISLEAGRTGAGGSEVPRVRPCLRGLCGGLAGALACGLIRSRVQPKKQRTTHRSTEVAFVFVARWVLPIRLREGARCCQWGTT